MAINQELIDEIIRRILSVASPQRIILFGSAAMGEMTRDSDIDLLVLEESPPDTREESIRLRGALRGLAFPFDVVVMPTSYFEETKGIIGGLAYPASKYGTVIYDAA